MNKANNEEVTIVGSRILNLEIEKSPDPVKRSQVKSLMEGITEIIPWNPAVKQRSIELVKLGFKAFDALHISSAEFGKVDFFLTTDDRIVKKYLSNREGIHSIVENPLRWLQETIFL